MTTAQELVRRVLGQDYAAMRAALRSTVPDTEPRRYLYDILSAYLANSGKAFRASLCLATCRAFGGRTEDAIDAAVAIELLHNAFLIHDDIEDASTLRRGRPALHETYGVSLALNAGDALCALALSTLARTAARQPAGVAATLFGELAHLFRRSVEGQAWELGWIADNCFSVSESDYLRMVVAKTCWYSTIHPCRLGALIGSGGKADLRTLVPFGLYLGACFQIRDDIDNLVPSQAGYGKNACGDILEGKRTIPVIHLLAHSTAEERIELVTLLSPESGIEPQERIERVLGQMTQAGSITYARDVADAFARMALEALPSAFAGATSRSDVEYVGALVLYLCGAMPADAPKAAAETASP